MGKKRCENFLGLRNHSFSWADSVWIFFLCLFMSSNFVLHLVCQRFEHRLDLIERLGGSLIKVLKILNCRRRDTFDKRINFSGEFSECLIHLVPRSHHWEVHGYIIAVTDWGGQFGLKALLYPEKDIFEFLSFLVGKSPGIHVR